MSIVSGIKPILSLQEIGISLEQKIILQDINLDVFAQEVITIVGPNGAGKSTLIKILLSILKPNTGQIIHHQTIKFAYVPQKFHLSPSLPLRVCDLLALERCDSTFKQQMLDELRIMPLLKHHVHQLSGGERQRVLLTRALLRCPNVLVLDEPMQGLDAQSEQELYEYVRQLPQRFGCSIIMISHDLQWVMQGTHRVICLNRHICCSGTPNDIQHHPEYIAIFGQNRALYQHQHQHCEHHIHQPNSDTSGASI